MVRYVLPYAGKNQTRRAQPFCSACEVCFVNLARGMKS